MTTELNTYSPPSDRTIHYHVMLWVDLEGPISKKPARRQRVNAGQIIGTRLIDKAGETLVEDRRPIRDVRDLSSYLAATGAPRRRVTVWLARGWADLVLSGLSEIMELGGITWRWCALDGAKFMLSGKLGTKPLSITSLACWTGGQWDAWHEDVLRSYAGIATPGDGPARDGGEFIMALEISAILQGRRILRAGRPALGIAGQARGIWRSWLAPRCNAPVARPRQDAGRHVDGYGNSILPILERPESARAAERQVCYGLPREQYVQGHIAHEVDVWDLSGAYCSALASFRCPTSYLKSESHITPKDLAEQIQCREAVALVRLDAPLDPYPIRIAGRNGRAVGKYWTWLCGAELNLALRRGHVTECEVAHIWTAYSVNAASAADLVALKSNLIRDKAYALAAFWRGCYSALVGQWAQWGRRWHDVPDPSPFGPWCSWTQTERETGEIRKYRCIAGRVQLREDYGDARNACPLAYGCITSMVRARVDLLRLAIDPRYIYAQSADSLWIDRRAESAVRMCLVLDENPIWTWRKKDTFDEAWMDGKGAAVVRVKDVLYPVLTGVPTHAELGADGKSRWRVSEPWNADGSPSKERGVGVTTASFDVEKLRRACSNPAVHVGPWMEFGAASMREELLQPVAQKGEPLS